MFQDANGHLALALASNQPDRAKDLFVGVNARAWRNIFLYGGTTRVSGDLDVSGDLIVDGTSPGGNTRTRSRYIFRRASSTPSTPSGGTTTADHQPSGWSAPQTSTSSPLTATSSQGVYRCSRTETLVNDVFSSATAWSAPTRVIAPITVTVTTETVYIFRQATSTPATPTSSVGSGPTGWSEPQTSTTSPFVATTTHGVYRSSSLWTYTNNVVTDATAWTSPTRVLAPISLTLPSWMSGQSGTLSTSVGSSVWATINFANILRDATGIRLSYPSSQSSSINNRVTFSVSGLVGNFTFVSAGSVVVEITPFNANGDGPVGTYTFDISPAAVFSFGSPYLFLDVNNDGT